MPISVSVIVRPQGRDIADPVTSIVVDCGLATSGSISNQPAMPGVLRPSMKFLPFVNGKVMNPPASRTPHLPSAWPTHLPPQERTRHSPR